MLNDLLDTSTTIPMIDAADKDYIDNLLSYLPPALLVLAQQGVDGDTVPNQPSAESVEAAKAAMSMNQKQSLLKKVLRSPQFHQSLGTLTMAIRDGGLPTVAASLRVPVKNDGYMTGGRMALGNGEAVEAFVEGVKKSVQDKQ